MNSTPLVSVIVPTRNSAGSLHACLGSIVRQTYSSIEIIVVDNNSSDQTLEIARAVSPRVYTYGPERSAQRNAGAREGGGTYLLFIDSDMILSPNVVEQCVRKATCDTTIKGIIIPEATVGAGFWACCKALERSCYVGDSTIEASRFFDHAAFNAVGGYDEGLTGPEDWDLSQRVGRRDRVAAPITHLEGRLSLRETMRSKFYYGKTMGIYMRKQPSEAGRQLQPIRPAFLRHWSRLLMHPILTVGMVFMKGCEFAAGAAGLIVTFWLRNEN